MSGLQTHVNQNRILLGEMQEKTNFSRSYTNTSTGSPEKKKELAHASCSPQSEKQKKDLA